MGWLRAKSTGKAAHTRTPLARSDQLVVEPAGEELLVYDQRSDRAHCLSSTAALVWRTCDGRSTAEQISGALALDVETVSRAIAELEACELLETPVTTGVTRREATASLAKMGAAAATAPLVYSITAPTPALAITEASCEAQTPGGKCNITTSCCSGSGHSCPSGCVCCRVEDASRTVVGYVCVLSGQCSASSCSGGNPGHTGTC